MSSVIHIPSVTKFNTIRQVGITQPNIGLLSKLITDIATGIVRIVLIYYVYNVLGPRVHMWIDWLADPSVAGSGSF